MIDQRSGAVDVSRETSARLSAYSNLLRKWTRRINLVAPSTLADLETRHIADSLQLWDLAPDNWHRWVDLGSGGGLPGAIIAILARNTGRDVVLVEADKRKAAFLRTVGRELDVPLTVHAERIENLDGLRADVLSARALAPLTTLLGYAERHLSPGGTALFPKGRNADSEVEEAARFWRFELDALPSKTSSEAVILRLKDIHRA